MQVFRNTIVILIMLFGCFSQKSIAQCGNYYLDLIFEKVNEHFDNDDYYEVLSWAEKLNDVEFDTFDTSVNIFICIDRLEEVFYKTLLSYYNLGEYSIITTIPDDWLEYFQNADSLRYSWGLSPSNYRQESLFVIMISSFKIDNLHKSIKYAKMIENYPYSTKKYKEAALFTMFRCYIGLGDALNVKSMLYPLYKRAMEEPFHDRLKTYRLFAESSQLLHDDKSLVIFDSVIRDIEDTLKSNKYYYFSNSEDIGYVYYSFKRIDKVYAAAEFLANSIATTRNPVYRFDNILTFCEYLINAGRINQASQIMNQIEPLIFTSDSASDEESELLFYWRHAKINLLTAACNAYIAEYDNAINNTDSALGAIAAMKESLDNDVLRISEIQVHDIRSTLFAKKDNYNDAMKESEYIVNFIDSLATIGINSNPYIDYYIKNLASLSYFYKYTKGIKTSDKETSKKYLEKAMAVYTDNISIYLSNETLISLGMMCYELFQYKQTIKILEKVHDRLKHLRQEEKNRNTNYAYLNQLLFLSYSRLEDTIYDDKILSHLEESTNAYKDFYKSLIFYSTTRSRKEKWNEIILHFQHFVHDIVRKKYKRNPNVSTIGYDAALFSKGILLETDKTIHEIIVSSGDSALIALFDTINTKNEMFVNEIERQRLIGIELSLMKELTFQENPLSNLSISWRDIQKVLPSNSAAIEFCATRNKYEYMAYIIKKDLDYPVFVGIDLWGFGSYDPKNHVKIARDIWGG